MPAELYTDITVGENTYAIKRFDARTGLKIARLVIAKAAPIIPLLDRGSEDPKAAKPKGRKQTGQNAADADPDNSQVYGAVGAILDSLSDEDLDVLIDKCLRVCYAKLPAGPQPIIDEMGHYGVEGVEYDMGLTLRLCFEAIKWGASDFFAGKGSLLNLFRK